MHSNNYFQITKYHIKSLVVRQTPRGESSIHTIMAVIPTWNIMEDVPCYDIQLIIDVQGQIQNYRGGRQHTMLILRVVSFLAMVWKDKTKKTPMCSSIWTEY